MALTRGFLFGFSFTRPLLVAFALILLLGATAAAQSTVALNGTVTDATGASIADAKVEVANKATGVTSASRTDHAGAYLFPALPIGTYRLEVSANGFQRAVLDGLALQVAMTVTRNVQLQVGQVSQQIDIEADAAVVETATTSVGQVINDKTVQEIPLNGRHFTDLSLLTPGTMTPPANGFLTAPLRGQGSFGINTAGQREDTTNWLVNGINLNDNVQNQLTFQPPIDTLAEYKIDNSTFSAQYGRNSGAIVNLATRSGTNDFHGEVFEFLRNNALDARNYFNPPRSSTGTLLAQAPFKRNDFGADFGGPLVKNKVFFFLAYEGLRQHQQLTVSTTVPNQQQRAAVTSPGVNNLLKLIPAANLVGTGTAGNPATFNGFTGSALANVNLNQGSADIDVVLSEKDQLHGYYVVQKDLRQEPTAGGAVPTNIPGFGDTRNGFRHLGTVSEDHVFSPAIANTVRLGFNRIHLTFTPNALLDPAAFGMTLPAGAPAATGLPFINVSGNVAFAGPLLEPQGRGDTTAVLNDTLSWLKGRHSFSFGGEIRRAYNNNIAENVGSFTFSSMANFLADKASQFTIQLGSGNDKILQPSYEAFVQDSFKWKPNFTINLGLRYAWNSSPSEAQNHFTNFDPATGSLVPASQPYQTGNKNFQPRVGIAWDPFGDGKTSIRSAYAMLTQAPTTNIVSQLSSNPPFAVPVSASSGSNSITLENPGAAVKGVSLGPTAVNRDYNDMYAQDWNLTIEHQFTPTTIASLAYVGMKATHEQLTENINQPFVNNGIYAATRPFAALPLSSPVLPPQCAAPNPPCPFGNIMQVATAGNSTYNALWATLNKHFSHGFELLASYTYSKSLDYQSQSLNDPIPLQNVYNPRGDYGPSEFDARQRFTASGFYQFPFKRNRAIEGWQLGVVTQAQTGNPLTPSVIIGPGSGISLTVRPDVTGPIQVAGRQTQWFANKSVFVSPCVTSGGVSACHPGDLGRDAITGPGFVNTDFSVIKDTKIAERMNFQFRAEMFDLFNHANFGNPVLSITSSSFGVIQGTRFPTGDFGSSRQIQFAAKVVF